MQPSATLASPGQHLCRPFIFGRITKHSIRAKNVLAQDGLYVAYAQCQRNLPTVQENAMKACIEVGTLCSERLPAFGLVAIDYCIRGLCQ
jgi:hypothetical protein